MDVDRLGRSFYYNDGAPLTELLKQLKHKTLIEAAKSGNILLLREHLRSSEGLMDMALRRHIWPLLLGLLLKDTNSPSLVLQLSAAGFLDDLGVNDLPPHRDEDQMKLDIKRSFTIVSHLRSTAVSDSSYAGIYSSSDIDRLRRDLLNLLAKIFRTHPALHYYQGYHDIASIVLLVCHDHSNPSDGLAFDLLQRLTLLHLRDFMITDINLSTIHLRLVPALLEDIDPPLFEMIRQTSNVYRLTNGALYDYSFVQGLSSFLTMFSHDIESLLPLLMTWDFILSCNLILACAYVYAAALVYAKEAIFQTLSMDTAALNFDHVDPDQVHTLVSPANLFSSATEQEMANILHLASQYLKEHPLDKLRNCETTLNYWFGKNNAHSVLNTTSTGGPVLDEYDSIFTSESDLAELILTQDEEVTKQTLIDGNILTKTMDLQDDSVTDEYSPSESHLLTSSISSLASGTSSINTRIAEASSHLLKRLIPSTHASPDPAKKPESASRVYKMSLAVGFVGFLVHFLIIKRNPEMFRLSHFMTGTWSVHTMFRSMSNFSGTLAQEVTTGARSAYESLTEQARFGIGKVGLGTLRGAYY